MPRVSRLSTERECWEWVVCVCVLHSAVCFGWQATEKGGEAHELMCEEQKQLRDSPHGSNHTYSHVTRQ